MSLAIYGLCLGCMGLSGLVLTASTLEERVKTIFCIGGVIAGAILYIIGGAHAGL